MKEPHNPHDRFFHYVFSEKGNVRDFLLNSLPGKITRMLDLDSIEVIPKSFVDRNLAAHHADLLIRTKHHKAPLLIYILVEHKSYPYKWTVFQLLKYMVCIWEKLLSQNSSIEQLTPIIPLIFYHGQEQWSHPLDFSAYFNRRDEAAEVFVAYIPDFTPGLFNLQLLDEGEIRGGIIYRAGLKALKYAAGRISPHLRDILQSLSKLPSDERLKAFLSALFRYILGAGKDTEAKDIDAELRSLGSGDAREVYMTIAERLIERGKLEGKREGILEGQRKGILEGKREGILEGEILEKQDVLLRLLEKKFGAVDDVAKARIKDLRDRDRLDRAIDRLLDTESIDDVLQALD